MFLLNFKMLITRALYVVMFIVLGMLYYALDNKLKSCEREKNMIAIVVAIIFIVFILSVV